MYKLKQKDKKIKKIPSEKRLLITLAIVSIFLVGSALMVRRYRSKSADVLPAKPTETINYGPTSPVEQKESDDHKDALVKDQNTQTQNPTTTTSGKIAVVPTITNASASTVNAYIMGIFEETGTCTATFTRDGVTKTKTSSGFGNVSYTQCAPIKLEQGFLSSGTWQLVVSYSSPKSEGFSTTKQVVSP